MGPAVGSEFPLHSLVFTTVLLLRIRESRLGVGCQGKMGSGRIHTFTRKQLTEHLLCAKQVLSKESSCSGLSSQGPKVLNRELNDADRERIVLLLVAGETADDYRNVENNSGLAPPFYTRGN